MTHDKLLAKIDKSVADIPVDYGQFDLVKALRAVVELHKPFNIDTDKPQCPRCMEPDFSHKGNPILVMASYPCETIQAIEKELG